MKTLHSLSDLTQYGVAVLTGEADRLGQRMLCDLSERGRDLVARFLGCPELDCFALPWNSSVGEVPAVSSVMLGRAALQELMLFAMTTDAAHAAVVRHPDGTLVGLGADDPYLERYRQLAAGMGYTIYTTLRSLNSQADRNMHVMTGRTV